MPRSLLTRAVTTLTALVSVTAVVSLGSPGQAAEAAAESVPRWSSSVTTVCVESHVGKEWDVKGALRHWNRLKGGPTFVQADHCEYEGSVTVRYESSDNGYAGWTDWYWDEAGLMVHADVTVNPRRVKAFDPKDRTCLRKHTTNHEFGHVLGLPHYPRSHSGAVMSYLGWQRSCGRLNGHDRSDFKDLYPAAVIPSDGPA